jgi:Rho GTPase-activating protein 10
MRELVKKLPKTNYETLCFLMKHLVKVAKLSDSNKMDATNLGIVFGPTLMRPQVESFESILNTAAHSIVVETIINHFDAIFR